MPIQKSNDPKTPPAGKPERKAWKKKTPLDVLLEQGQKLSAEIAEMEKDLAGSAVSFRNSKKRENCSNPRSGREGPRRSSPTTYAPCFPPYIRWNALRRSMRAGSRPVVPSPGSSPGLRPSISWPLYLPCAAHGGRRPINSYREIDPPPTTSI